MPAGLQDLPVLQPGELGLRLALRLAGEDGRGAHGPSDGLRGLDKLCRSWKQEERISLTHSCKHQVFKLHLLEFKGLPVVWPAIEWSLKLF